MLQEVETKFNDTTEIITMTSAAASAFHEMLAEHKAENLYLRVYVAGKGCCGTKLGMALDGAIHQNDITFESAGVKMLVDDQSIDTLRGAKIDFVNDPKIGTGFLIESPNVQQEGDSCACEGGNCGCGGNC